MEVVNLKFMHKLNETLNSGDREIATWFLIRQTYLPFILSASYAVFMTVIGPSIMRDRKPFNLRKTMIAFNFTIVSTYLICLGVLIWHIPYITKEQWCISAEVRKGDFTYTVMSAGWIIYMLKYIEWFDTLFFVLRKKENLITFLHVIHHAIVPLLGWIILRTEKSGFQGIPVILNGLVHIVMYTYYGLAAMGPHVKKYLWWKKHLTQLQLIQFCLIIFFVAVVAPLSGCKMVMSSYLIDFFLAPFFLYLFYRYYKAKFVLKVKVASNGVHKGE